MFDSNLECKFQNVMMTTRQWKQGDYCMAKYWQDGQVGHQWAVKGLWTQKLFLTHAVFLVYLNRSLRWILIVNF